MTPDPATRWRILGMEGLPRLDVELVVATTAPAVIETIELAADQNGIMLQRVFEDEEVRCINCRQLLQPGEDCGHRRHSWCCLVHSEAT